MSWIKACYAARAKIWCHGACTASSPVQRWIETLLKSYKQWFIGSVLTETLLQKPKSKRNAWFSSQHLLSKQSSSPNKLPPPRISVTESQGCPSIHIYLSRSPVPALAGCRFGFRSTQLSGISAWSPLCIMTGSGEAANQSFGKPRTSSSPQETRAQQLMSGVILNRPGCTTNSQSTFSKTDCRICCDKGYAHIQNEEKCGSY